MNVFLNDYNDLCHEKVLEELSKVNKKGNIGYGYDKYSELAKTFIKRDLKNEDVHIEFVAGGTIANIIAIVHGLRHFEGVIAAETGHIFGHETASIEATGHKIETIKTKDGKLTSDDIKRKMKNFKEEFEISPKLVYISNTTELGSVYKYEEVKNLYKTCKEYGLYLYIDGARMANALSASDIKIEDMPKICDIFTIGGTKNGAIYGEALVIVEDDLKHNIRRFMKQRGAIMAKGFALGAQFSALFRDGLYYKLAKDSQDMSEYLAKKLKEISTEFFIKAESNQIFIKFPKEKVELLRENNYFEVIEEVDQNTLVIRFVTSYRTSKEEVDALIEDISKILV